MPFAEGALPHERFSGCGAANFCGMVGGGRYGPLLAISAWREADEPIVMLNPSHFTDAAPAREILLP